jgi:hypothetical protein
MAWLESHQELARHPKVRRLAKALGVSVPTAVGHLHLLWWWALDFAADGDVSRYEPDELAEAALWEGDPRQFIGALETAGFLDPDSHDGAHLHDWHDYGGKVIAQRQANARRQAEWRDRQRPPAPPTPDPALRNGRAAQHRPLHNADVTVTSQARNAQQNRTEQNTTPHYPPDPPVDIDERERDSRGESPSAHAREGQADSQPPPPLSLSRQASMSRPRPRPPDALPSAQLGPPADALADALADELGYAPPRDWLPRLANGGLTPETVPKVCRLYRETFGAGIPLTPRALHNNLPHLLAKVNGHGDPAQRAARRAAAEEDERARLADLKARLVREIPGELFDGGIARAVC